MNQRRQVGFIKSYSNKQLILQDQPSQFSYFKIKGRQDEEEFSPYKFEEDQVKLTQTTKVQKKQLTKPPLPVRGRQMEQAGTNLADKAKADTLYDKIKQRIASYEQKRSASKQKLQQNIGNIRNKIQRLDQVLKDLKTHKQPTAKQEPNRLSRKHQKYQEDNSSSQSEQQEVVITSIPSPKMPSPNIPPEQLSEVRRNSNSRQRVTVQDSKNSLEVREPNQQYHSSGQEQSQQQEEESHQMSSQNRSKQQHPHSQQVITFNSRTRNQPPLYIQPYSSSQSQSEQAQMQPKHIPQRDHAMTKQTHGNTQFYKNKGGVCFDVDIKQFTVPLPPEKKEKQVIKKKEKVDPRAQLLRRRQTAKAYDKKARRALFSPY